jgi:hypothetical protein
MVVSVSVSVSVRVRVSESEGKKGNSRVKNHVKVM